MRRHTIQQAAFDKGVGARGVSYQKANPYHPRTSPSLWEAWERGWQKADAALTAGREGGA